MLCKRNQGRLSYVGLSPTEGAAHDSIVEEQTPRRGSLLGFKDHRGGPVKTRKEKKNRGEQTHILISFLLSRLDWKRLHFTLKLVHLHVQRVDHVLVGGKHAWTSTDSLDGSIWIPVWINDFNHNIGRRRNSPLATCPPPPSLSGQGPPSEPDPSPLSSMLLSSSLFLQFWIAPFAANRWNTDKDTIIPDSAPCGTSLMASLPSVAGKSWRILS